MSSIGTMFKSAREQLGLSVGEVAERSRLSRRYIEAIEANDFQQIPGNVYVSNFCRIYARALNLPEQEMLSHLPLHIRAESNAPPIRFAFDQQLSPGHVRNPVFRRRAVLAVGVLVMVLTILGTTRFF